MKMAVAIVTEIYTSLCGQVQVKSQVLGTRTYESGIGDCNQVFNSVPIKWINEGYVVSQLR